LGLIFWARVGLGSSSGQARVGRGLNTSASGFFGLEKFTKLGLIWARALLHK
jgi:hypothetical protein